MTHSTSSRIVYQPRTPDETLEIDPETNQPLVITRTAPKDAVDVIPFTLAILLIVAVATILVATFIFPDLFFG